MIEKVIAYGCAVVWAAVVTLFFSPAPLPVSTLDLARASAYCRGSAVLMVESRLRMLRRIRTVECFDGTSFDMDRDNLPNPLSRRPRWQ